MSHDSRDELGGNVHGGEGDAVSYTEANEDPGHNGEQLRRPEDND